MAGSKYDKRAKHYTAVERSYFLQVIDKYKHIIECKKSSVNTLRDKEIAWVNICDDFNNSPVTMQHRSIQQLKKLWTNLKHAYRYTLTKEKQNRFATGGGPEMPSVEIDADVAAIAPTLMSNAPNIITSNLTVNELNDAREMIFSTNEYNIENYMDPVSKTNDLIILPNTDTLDESILEQPRKRQKVRETEEELKILRLKNIMQHEERLATIKEQHVKKLNELEIRAASAKAELAQLLLSKEKANLC